MAAAGSFGAQLKALREAAGYTQEELAAIAGLSVHGISALERGERRRPHVDTVRALSAALDLTGATRDAFVGSARAPAADTAVEALAGVPLSILPAALPGREHAVAELHGWLEKARRRQCQVVFVTGEAGIGKTTLIDTFARSVASDPGVRICRGQCLEHHGMSEAYLPVLEAIRQLCREDVEVVDVLRRHGPMWLMQMPSLVTSADRESIARETLGATRERMLREMGEVLDVLTARATLMFVLEDLHWSDFSTLDLISYVARRRRAASLMFVGTYRPGDLIESRHPLRTVKQELVASRQCEELPLDYLNENAVRQHLAARFPASRFPVELATFIHERTEGNPLFMVNTIEHMIAERLIEPHQDGWRLVAPIEAVKVGVPESIRQLIDTHVDRLDAGDQRILEAASVAGAEFSVAAVSAALDADLAAVELRCEALSRRHQFITEIGAQLLDDGQSVGRFSFVHALYRHALYDRVSASRRMQLHRRVGLRSEDLYGERASEFSAELAVHFEQAADYDRAARYLEQASVNAMHRSAYREAIAASRHGLELLARLPVTDGRARQEVRLRIALGGPLIATAGYGAAEVGDVYRGAQRLCERLGPTPEVSKVFWGLWSFHLLQADLSAARGIASEFLGLAERVPGPSDALRGHWAMGVTVTFQGNCRAAHEQFDKALSLYDPDQYGGDIFIEAINPGVAVRCFDAWSLWFMGKADRAVTRIADAVALARGLSEPHGVTRALAFAAVLHQLRRETSMAQHYADAAMALADEHGLLFYGAMAQIVRGWALVGRGDDAHAADQIRQGLAAWQRTGAKLMRPHFLALLSETYAPTDQDDQGITILDEALTLARSAGERMYEAEICRLRGERLSRGAHSDAELRQAEACLEQARALAREQDALSVELRAAMSLARLHRGRDGQVAVRNVLRSIYERFDEGFDTADLREARDLLDQEVER